jgi:hypothetical protein
VTAPLYATCGIPKSSWYRWLGRLVLANRDASGRYSLCPREQRLARIAGALHRLGIREPQLAPLLGRLREMSAPERAALIESLIIMQTGRRTWAFFDTANAVPQIRALAVHRLIDLLEASR